MRFDRASVTVAKSEPDAEWHEQGLKIYGYLRQKNRHARTISFMMVNCPDVVDWIDKAQENWRKAYEQA